MLSFIELGEERRGRTEHGAPAGFVWSSCASAIPGGKGGKGQEEWGRREKGHSMHANSYKEGEEVL